MIGVAGFLIRDSLLYLHIRNLVLISYNTLPFLLVVYHASHQCEYQAGCCDAHADVQCDLLLLLLCELFLSWSGIVFMVECLWLQGEEWTEACAGQFGGDVAWFVEIQEKAVEISNWLLFEIVVVWCRIIHCCGPFLVDESNQSDRPVINSNNFEPRGVHNTQHCAHAIDEFSLPINCEEVINVHAEPSSQLDAVC